MTWWAGASTAHVRDRIVGWGGLQKIQGMQEELLMAGGKRSRFWQRLWAGSLCPCVKENQPQVPHSICYGTGWVGGYKEYGWREWLIYRKSALLYGVITPEGSYDIIPTVVGTQHTVTTNYIPGTMLTAGLVKSNQARTGITITYSVNSTVWTPTLTGPVTQFKIRIVAEERNIEIVRVRGKESADEILISEQPPRRVAELLKWGLEDKVGDIRCWTIAQPVLYSGDIVEWKEGQWDGQRYTIVDKKASQFRKTATESEAITQLLSMRKADLSQQIGRIW